MKLVGVAGQHEWSALYADGKLVYQASTMDFGQFMRLIREELGGFPITIEAYGSFELNDEQQAQLDEHGSFPLNFIDLAKDDWFGIE